MKPTLLLRGALTAALALCCIGALAQAARPPIQREAPPLLLRTLDAQIPIQLARVQVQAQVVGLAAHTRVELEFFNPNNQLLEGELQFPLSASQTVSGFALDIGGELRPAVPVDKAKGRQVFEDVTRTRVDPALLEATGGNNYKLRVYPLPPRGSRRVVLEIAESLLPGRAGASYRLPLQFGMPAGRLEVAVTVPSTQARGRIGARTMAMQRGADGSALLTLSLAGHAGGAPLQVDLPLDASRPQLQTEEFQDATSFYAEVPAALQQQPRTAPRTLAIVWDASGSAAARDRDRELALLGQYLQALRNVTVELLVVRDVAEAPRRFLVRDGDWSALRSQLQQTPHDGATRLEQMVVPPGAELALLFSDGLGTYGERGLPASAVPLYAISSSQSADAQRLRQAAEASGGQWLDLARMAPAEAARELRVVRTRLAGLEAIGATDLVAEGRYPAHGRLAIAGRLTDGRAEVLLHLQAADGTRSTRRLAVQHGRATCTRAAMLSVAAHRWAALKLAELEAERDQNRQAIRRLGARFGLVTSGTSLIVLDAVGDYARHGIEPPPSLRAAYEQLVGQQQKREQATRETHVAAIARRFAEKQAWWDREFPKDDPRVAEAARQAEATRQAEALRQAEAARQQARSAAADDAPQRRSAPTTPPAMSAPPPPPAPAAAPAPMARIAPAPAPAAAGRAAAPEQRAEPAASIALKPWTPDSPYARRLRAASPDAMYAIYLDERPGYTSSTAFFLDAADLFLERGQPQLARRILSNLAEMDLENRHILRILAYRLLQAGEVKTALPLLRKVLVLSPDEPQSYRDLALALASDGQPQAAIQQLWEVVSRPWNNRFPDIELIALAELNAIVARAGAAGQALDTRAIDPRLLRNLPLDLRVVLAWDADNTDIDLWVVDPNGERAYYGRQLTYQGGRMSRDFTGGYGPEEFSLRRARPGTYTIRAQFYGHRQQIVAPATTLMLRLTTGFGTPAQKDADTVLRLSGASQEITIGTFEVPATGASQ